MFLTSPVHPQQISHTMCRYATPTRYRHTRRPIWYRCKEIRLIGDMVRWELDRGSRYGLMDAYTEQPHREFMRAGDDTDLLAFLKKWGPLWTSQTWRSGRARWTYSGDFEMS